MLYEVKVQSASGRTAILKVDASTETKACDQACKLALAQNEGTSSWMPLYVLPA